MKKMLTRDGSYTFVNEELEQSYHSFTGAVEEALEKYAKPCKIAELAKKTGESGGSGVIKILDVAFGMGYNSAMAISVALAANPDVKVEIVGLEIDPEILDKIGSLSPKIAGYEKFHVLNSKDLSFSSENLKVSVLLGDAHETVKGLDDFSFDVCFFDMFSPSVQPQMWSEELFASVFRVLKKGAVLSTYSCARLVRDNLKKVGFSYDDGPKVGRRGPGTLAWKD